MLMVGTAVLTGIVLTIVDVTIGTDWTEPFYYAFGVGAEGARGMLGAIAGSMMTVASLTFSLTITTLATASTQYTSRLVRNFMRDRINQFVLGYFVGLFAYCLVVMRTIRSGDDNQFVPAIAVLVGLVGALVSIIVLIYFIHHIAESIQAGTILKRVTNETLEAIDKLFPSQAAEPMSDELPSHTNTLPAQPSENERAVQLDRFGYVRSIDTDTLMEIATERDTMIRLVVDVGQFVTPQSDVCTLVCDEPLDDETCERLKASFETGPARTIEQDAAFGIRQIVDIAMKALSPGVNDTTTGVMSIEHLGVIVERLADRDIPDRVRGKDGNIRLLTGGRSFATLVAGSFDQIRQCASGNVAVLEAMFNALAHAGRQTDEADRRAVLAKHVGLVQEVVEESIKCVSDATPLQILGSKTLLALQLPPVTAKQRGM